MSSEMKGQWQRASVTFDPIASARARVNKTCQDVEAILDEIQGEEAFLELAAWRDCLYRFDPENAPKKRAIQTSTNKLLRIAALSDS